MGVVRTQRRDHVWFCLRTLSAGAGGALRLSGSVKMKNVTFKGNSAMSEGPAISNIGSVDSMSLVSFVDNYFFCGIGEFLEYEDTTVSAKTVRNFRLCPVNEIYLR